MSIVRLRPTREVTYPLARVVVNVVYDNKIASLLTGDWRHQLNRLRRKESAGEEEEGKGEKKLDHIFDWLFRY